MRNSVQTSWHTERDAIGTILNVRHTNMMVCQSVQIGTGVPQIQ